MAPKGKSKGGSKQLLALAQLTALQATYKAASRRHGVSALKPMLQLMEDSIQEQAAINKVSLTGPDITFGELAAVLDCLAGYGAVKNLCLWSCNVGDKGLVALGMLLKASAADKWWRGSKIKHLEVCADGIGFAPECWGERYMAHANGALPTMGAGMQLPSLVLGQAPAVTPDTIKMQDQELPPSWLPPKEGEPGGAGGSLAATWQPEQSDDEDPNADDGGGRDDGDDDGGDGGAGGSDEVVAENAGTPPRVMTPPDRSDAGSEADDSHHVPGTACTGAVGAATGTLQGSAAVKSSASRAIERLKQYQDSDLDGRFSHTFAATVSLTSVTYEQRTASHALAEEHRHDERRILGLPPLLGAPDAPMMGRGALPAAPRPLGGAAGIEVGTCGSAGGAPTCSSVPSFRQHRPMAWSTPALKTFSLGLSVLGCSLQVLALDHNELGNAGMRVLAQGLKRCMNLKHLSLEDCGIGHAGAASLALTMVPDADQNLAALQPSYAALNLSRNPLGGAGLTALCEGLEHCDSLMILNLASTELTAADSPALKTLAHVLTKRTNIDQVDLDANFFGDIGAAAFIPFLAQAKHMRKFRITARGMSRAVGGAIGVILKDNHPKKKGSKKAKKK